MRNGFLGSIGGLLASACFVFGQTPSPTAPAPLPQSVSADHDMKTAPATADGDSKPHSEGVLNGLLSSHGGTCDPACGGAWYGSAEYLLWWIKDARLVPLVSTDALGNPDTLVLFGGKDITYNKLPFSGGRFTVGYWQTECPSVTRDDHRVGLQERPWGIEGSYFVLADRTTGFNNDLSPTLIRPFFDLNNRQESGQVVAFPHLATGSVAVSAHSGLWGAEANFWKNFRHEHFPLSNWRIDLVAGFRYLDLGEDLSIVSLSNYFQNQQMFPNFLPFAGNRIATNDLFGTRNQFYGGQVGAVWKWFFDELTLDFGLKLALGSTHEDIHIEGFQKRTFPNGVTTISHAGILALGSNSGRFTRDDFAVVPELNFHLTYQLSNHVTLLFGYTFLWWSKVARPGDQIDRVVDITQIPNFLSAGAPATGFPRPAQTFKDTNFWATGASVGVEFVW